MSDWNPTMDLENALNLLSHPYRRAILYCLIEADESLTQDKLAAQIGTWQESAAGGPSEEVHQQICIQLSHCHLPKLAAVNVIEYDKRHGDVVLADKVDDLQPLLDLIQPVDDFPKEMCDCPCQ
ncbi:DUF7344 domain-containing protein [Halomarina pelagica]|uniref:DUF7344 domain-containing protein n=1 Tax=Halomarina pelagica TaxID=2961599 RepID=UPI0020C2A559|nr:hypothetical protein [Halomarina sp. BND7]